MKRLVIFSILSAIFIINCIRTIESSTSGELWERRNGSWKTLFEASRDGDVEKAKEEIRKGIDVNIKGPKAHSALHIAAEHGAESVAKILIDNGADVNAIDEDKWTPLHMAAWLNHEPVAELLIEKEANINALSERKETPMHLAVSNGNEDIVKLLIDKRAQVRVKNFEGRTPLGIATERGRKRISALLQSVSRAEEECRMYSTLQFDRRINNGKKVDNRQFPWMATLGYVNERFQVAYKCSGTIISEKFILTAANCRNNVDRPFFVRLGIANLTDPKSGVRHDIKTFIPHPYYSKHTRLNNIALIRLEKKIEFNRAVFPACLQTNVRDEPQDVKLTVAGWSKAESNCGSQLVDILKTEMITIPSAQCNGTWDEATRRSHYCAYNPENETARNDCEVGSGGSLQFIPANSSIATVVGIVKFGGVTCGTELAGVYTRVASYAGWIESIVWTYFIVGVSNLNN